MRWGEIYDEQRERTTDGMLVNEAFRISDEVTQDLGWDANGDLDEEV